MRRSANTVGPHLDLTIEHPLLEAERRLGIEEPDEAEIRREAADRGFSEHNRFLERLDKGPEDEPYLSGRRDQYAKDITTHTGHRYTLMTDGPGFGGRETVTAHRRLSNGKYQGVGYLTWFGGKPEDRTGSNTDPGTIYKVYVAEQHQRRGVASAMLDFARERYPHMDIRHSNALTDDGRAWAEKKATCGPRTSGRMLDLYHRTTPEAAEAIHRERRMTSKENTQEAYFSNRRDGHTTGYGEGVVRVRVPEHLAELDDEFPDGEQHYRVRVRDLRPEHFVRQAATEHWPPYLTEKPDRYGDVHPANVSRSNPRGPVGSPEDALRAGLVGPYFHGTSRRRARQIRSEGFRQPRLHDWEMANAGTAEEVDLGRTHRTFFTPDRDEALSFARAHHGDDADVVTAYLHPDHIETDKGGGWMPSVTVKDVAHAMAITHRKPKTAATESVYHYHVSPAANRDSIAEHGLRLGDGGRIWLYPNEEQARAHNEVFGRGDDIYLVDVSGYRTTRDPHLRGGAGSMEGRVIRQPVPPERIERLGSLDLHQIRVLNPTTGFDPDLFDGEKLKPEVRQELIRRWTGFCARHELVDWSRWAKLYFTGGEASEWSGPGSDPNGDFDMQVGLDFPEFRQANSKFAVQDDASISFALNAMFWIALNDHDFHPAGSVRAFDLTWYSNPAVNPKIQNINPYAAYDVLADQWVVHPKTYRTSPHIGPAMRKALQGAERYARQILTLPEPQRTREAAALFEAWHSDRSLAFGPGGLGVFDYANLRMKALEATGIWQQLQDAANRIGRTAKLPKTQKCKYCANQATSRVIHSEGMAYVPACDKHLDKAKHDAARCTPDGSVDESNIDAVRKIAELRYMPLGEFRQLMSNDHGVPVAHVHDALREEYKNQRLDASASGLDPDDPHSIVEVGGHYTQAHAGGPDKYIEQIKKSIAEHGIRRPPEVADTDRGRLLSDGHHRAVAIHELGIDPVPINYTGDYRTRKGTGLTTDASTRIGMQVHEYEGEVGNRDHITRSEVGYLPIDVVRHMRGARGEVPGEHRNRQGQDWEAFKTDVAANGIREPIFITVDHGQEPVLNEGSHRRDAAIELGHTHIPAEVRYFGHAERQGTVEQRARRRAEASRRTASRLDRAWGSIDPDTLFGDAPTTTTPWPSAGRRRDVRDYDDELVKQALLHPEHHHMTEVDPRELRATQPSITREGVNYYLGDQYRQTGRTFADMDNAGNRRPVVYHREDGQKLLLSGHHRAAAALLRGEPFQAVMIEGPWGRSRR